MLGQVRKEGELRVITRNSPTTYYYGREGLAGFDHDLTRMFAEHIGVRPRFIVADVFGEIIPAVKAGDAHMAVAGITVTDARKTQVRFGPPVQTVTQQVVYRAGLLRPRKVADLIGRDIEVVAGSSYVERLRELKRAYTDLAWHETDELSSDELLNLVYEKVIDLTIADSNLVAVNRRLNPELRIGFEISDPQQLAWAFPHSADDSLYDAASSFLNKLEESGELDVLLDRYYGHVERFDYVDMRVFQRHAVLRLPEYQSLFAEAAQEQSLDWRLLAAMGYQESHWKPEAVSPTGVRGIMMLTRATAKQVGVEDRSDPRQSIFGGAEYLASIQSRIPDTVLEPDRTWMALAAYNVGFGHLEDARDITRKRDGDPNRWVDVKESLPLLSQKKWYRDTRYGFARGKEPVRYVENIRSYHDLLLSILEPKPAPLDKSPALSINAPAL